MRKSIIKILVAVLTLSLLLGAIVGITAMAADEGEVYLKSADIERNVKYDSKTYLLYRIAQTAIAEDDKAGLSLEIADAEGNFVGKVTPKVDGDYYVFVTQGVPAKELNTEEVVTVKSGSKAISPAITWSVEEYLYTRLYADGFADKVEADGDDFARRELYYDLLKYGVEAQKVLAPDAEKKIASASFAYADDALATYGRFDEPTKITLRYDTTKTPEGETFIGWECNMYDDFGDLIDTLYAVDGSVITADGYVKARPVYQSEFYTPTFVTFDDIEELPANVTFTTSLDAEAYNISLENDNLSFAKTKTGKGSISYVEITPNTKIADPASTVFEADFAVTVDNLKDKTEISYITIYSGAKSSVGQKVYWGLFRAYEGYIRLDYQWTKDTAGGQVAHTEKSIKTPMKADGTSYRIRLEYYEGPWGEDCFFFYVDGELAYSSSYVYAPVYNDAKTNPPASDIGCIIFNLPESTSGVMTFDNVAMTQSSMPRFSKLGADDSVIDFDASSKGITTAANTETKYFSYDFDKKTGSTYLLVSKYATGTGNTMAVEFPVTYAEEGADFAVISFDYYMEDSVTRLDNQLMLGHANYSSIANGSTPILPSLPTSASDVKTLKGKWIHVEITYEVLEYAKDGTVSKIKYSGSASEGAKVNVPYDETTGVYKNGGSYFKIFGNPGKHSTGIDVPTVEQLTKFKFSFNQNAYGDVRLDNLSFKLINKTSD